MNARCPRTATPAGMGNRPRFSTPYSTHPTPAGPMGFLGLPYPTGIPSSRATGRRLTATARARAAALLPVSS
jgi:hypothetical protein